MSFGPQKLLRVFKMVGPQPEGGGPDSVFSGDAGMRYNNRFLNRFNNVITQVHRPAESLGGQAAVIASGQERTWSQLPFWQRPTPLRRFIAAPPMRNFIFCLHCWI
jgi:hypothetical protein